MAELKVLYFALVSPSLGGVEKKIISQFSEISKNSVGSGLYLITEQSPSPSLKSACEEVKGITVEHPLRRIQNPITRRRWKFAKIDQIMNRFDPASTVIYMRYPASDHFFLSLLKKNSEYNVVTEHQEIERTLKARHGNRGKRFFESIYGKSVRKRIAGFVGVTEEILQYEYSRIGGDDTPGYVCPNGVSVESVPIRKLGQFDPSVLKVLFVGSPYLHHGLDRLINGLKNYYRTNPSVKVDLTIAGESHELRTIIHESEMDEIEKHVNFTGFLEGEDLDLLFDTHHLAIGALAIHRAGSGSPLKSKEYCARGIPFVDSAEDGDFHPEFPFRLKIDSSDCPLDIHQIIRFGESVLSDSDHPFKMREYAKENLDWKSKMKQLVDFLERVMTNYEK